MGSIREGDYVIRKSHDGDVVFRVTRLFEDPAAGPYCELKGMHLRLVADAPLNDLELVSTDYLRKELLRTEGLHNANVRRILLRRSLERGRDAEYRSEVMPPQDFFELPGRVLHIDGDEEYLKMCLKTYQQLNVTAVGFCIDEAKQPEQVRALLLEHQPNILVLTGHDALIGGAKKDFSDLRSYRNSKYFIESVRRARSLEQSRDSLVIFAGACQSYFEAILAAGANFASAPSRIFIHAYDPVFIVEKVAFTPVHQVVDVNEAIAASVTGAAGVGGVETRGQFRLGLPKTPYAPVH